MEIWLKMAWKFMLSLNIERFKEMYAYKKDI